MGKIVLLLVGFSLNGLSVVWNRFLGESIVVCLPSRLAKTITKHVPR